MTEVKAGGCETRQEAELLAAVYREAGHPYILMVGEVDSVEVASQAKAKWLVVASDKRFRKVDFDE